MKTRRILIAVVIVVLVGAGLYMNPLLPIITGYSAKNLSSGVFVAHRTQESLEATDLNFSFIKYVHNKVDVEKKEVTSRFLWHRSKAVYIDGFGCCLVHDFTEEEINSRPFTKVPIFPENPDTIAWPMGDKLADTIPEGIHLEKLQTALNKAFADTLPHKGTFAVAVVYKNQLVAERYKNGFSKEHNFLSWSMAKSFTNALMGILVKQGKLDIKAAVPVNNWQNDARKNITYANLMHMNTGLEWNENYGSNSDVNVMLHKVGDMGKFAFEKNQKANPDSVWLYSSGTTNIASFALRQLIHNDSVYYSFPRTGLFNKIGMRSAVFEVDASGTFVGSSYLYASLRDYARFGLLYLNQGNWLGEQILPEGWIDYTATEANGSVGEYGAFFWLNKNGKNYPDAPRDMFYCAGHDGQFIYIIPSKQLVIVRTGFSKKGWFDLNEFVSEIVNSVE